MQYSVTNNNQATQLQLELEYTIVQPFNDIFFMNIYNQPVFPFVLHHQEMNRPV